MTSPQNELTQAVQLLAGINRLNLKAFKTAREQELIFLILNDTASVARYDRAVLWNLDKVQVIGVSGQATVSKQTDLMRRWKEAVKGISDPEKIQLITSSDIPSTTSVLWLPIFAHGKLALGLWLERWNEGKWSKEEVEILQFLMAGYGAAWEKFHKKFVLRKHLRRPLTVGMLIAFCLLFLIRLPLRVVAPSEVVPKDPVVITAPLEGIIELITVTPGQDVEKGTLLFEYDKRVPLEELRIAQKKVQIIKAEVDRSQALGLKDKKALAELGTNLLKLKKEKLDLELAEYRASQLNVKSPVPGVAMVDNPEEWHGKPVKVGEKVMVIGNPKNTKIRMWIPEDDNITIDYNKPLKVFLNVNPEKSRKAHLIYISDYTHVTEKSVTSFIGEAEWDDQAPDIKLGLKGTTILYGEDVTLFYWIVRKPWGYVRRFFGI